MNVLVYFNSLKKNYHTRWISAKVVEPTPHTVLCRRSEKGTPISVSYGDIRILPGKISIKSLATMYADDDMPEEDNSVSAVDNIESLRTTATGNPIKNIGVKLDDRTPFEARDFVSDEKKVLDMIRRTFGTGQVTRHKLEGIPAWIVQKAVDKKHDKNWETAYDPAPVVNVSRTENIIASNVIYKLKIGDAVSMRFKAQIFLHGNRDRMKDEIRKDSSTAQCNVIRILLSMAAYMDGVLA